MYAIMVKQIKDFDNKELENPIDAFLTIPVYLSSDECLIEFSGDPDDIELIVVKNTIEEIVEAWEKTNKNCKGYNHPKEIYDFTTLSVVEITTKKRDVELKQYY